MSDDVTHCPGGDCPLRHDCYRFRALVFGRFDAFVRAPYDLVSGTCDHHWSLARLAPTEADVRTRAYLLWQRRGSSHGSPDADWSAAQAELSAALAARLAPIG